MICPLSFDDDVGLNVVRCWADILGTEKSLSIAYSIMMWGLMSSDVGLAY